MDHAHNAPHPPVATSGWQSIAEFFSETDFMPHGHCYLWKPALVWTHVISDLLIGLAYVSISLTLYGLVRKINLSFNTVVLCFGVFIGACGWTHFNEIWNLWFSDYWYSGGVKVVTAIASVGTGVYLIKLRHPLVTVAEAAKLSEQRRLDLEALTVDLEKRVEERTKIIAEKEARLRLAQQVARVGTFEWHIKTGVNNWTPELEALYGLSPGSFGGRFEDWQKLVHPEDFSVAEQLLRNSLTTGSFEAEWRVVWPDGSIHWLAGRGYVEKDAEGKAERMIGINIDITKQKLLELERDRSEMRFQAIVENMSEGLMLFDTKQNLIYQNPASVHIHNGNLTDKDYTHNQQLAGEWVAWNDEGRQISFEEWPASRVFRGEVVKDEVLRVRNFDSGYEFYGSYNGSPVFDTEGNFILGFITIRDISEFKRFEIALRESEAKFRTITEAMPQMVWSTRPDGFHDYFNLGWYEFTGMPKGSTDGAGWNEMFHPDDRQHAWEVWKHSLESGEPYEIEYRLKHHSGVYRWTLGRALPIKDKEGKIIRWMGTCTDIHDQKELSESLKHAVLARDEFLSIASHELKTPLTSLVLQNQLMRKVIERDEQPTSLKEKVEKLVDQNEKHYKRLSRLVDDMLDISRMSTGRLILEKERFDLCSLTKEVSDRMQSQIMKARVNFNIVECPPLEGFWDKFRIEQVLVNLMTNALKYGAGRPVDMRIQARGDKAILSIQDRGIGIAKEDQERIFQRFERAISANEVSGLGLGLYISQEIMIAHGGIIRVESEPGKGATFSMELPIEPA